MHMNLKHNLVAVQALAKQHRELSVFIVSLVVGGLLILAAEAWPMRSVAGSITESDAAVTDVVIAPPSALLQSVPELTGVLPAVETIDAFGFIVRDVETGAVLYEKASEGIRPIASITKLMTALTLMDIGIDWSGSGEVVTDDGLIDNHMYAGDTYSTEDLWLSMLVASSNKAAMTLVDMTADNRDAFVTRMNSLAAEYGMTESTFVEPTGLNANNVSTPQNISILLDKALSTPAIRDGLRTIEHTIYSEEREKSHHMWNTNWLLLDWIPNDFYYIIGGKTGFIDASRYNFSTRVVTIDGKILDVVVLGAASHEERFTVARDVIDAVLDAYTWGSTIQE